MVDTDIVAELVSGVFAFVRPAVDADGARGFGFRKLPDDRTDSAGRGGDDDGLALFRRNDLVDAIPSGDAGHPHRPDIAWIGTRRVSIFCKPLPSESW